MRESGKGNMEFAERLAAPVDGELGKSVRILNDFKEVFFLRWGRIRFDAAWGSSLNIKVILKVHRSCGICEHFIVDTDSCEVRWNAHKRVTRDFYIHPFPAKHGRVTCVKFSYIVHLKERSIPSEFDYIFMDGHHFNADCHQRRSITNQWATPNELRAHEVDASLLQRDVDWYNHHMESLNAIPKFTRGVYQHPFHPKRYIHDNIDKIIHGKHADSKGPSTIKVSVDCIDDTDFIDHLIYASENRVKVQCIVDWRKMTLTNSESYARLKRSGVELLGVFCTPRDPLIEVAPDMHTKFIIFGDQDCILGSFNITFDRWWANWESGFTFHSHGVCRLLDNVFQSIRGGHIQRYGIDPLSPFNLLYTFGRHTMLNGKTYRPHHAILSEIHRAERSIKACLFLLGELQGEHNDSVVDALIQARRRGVDVQIVFNGHMARQGNPAREYSMKQELERPLLPAISRLRQAGIPIALAYGLTDHAVPYSPLHSKYCIIDERIVLDGSFNWYNTSVFSHDLLVVAASQELARPYLHELHQILRSFRVYWI